MTEMFVSARVSLRLLWSEVLTLSSATVDEHLQKVGAEAFNKFERCGPSSMLLGLNSFPLFPAVRRIINLDKEVRHVTVALFSTQH